MIKNMLKRRKESGAYLATDGSDVYSQLPGRHHSLSFFLTYFLSNSIARTIREINYRYFSTNIKLIYYILVYFRKSEIHFKPSDKGGIYMYILFNPFLQVSKHFYH
jgi:hypothetical protein